MRSSRVLHFLLISFTSASFTNGDMRSENHEQGKLYCFYFIISTCIYKRLFYFLENELQSISGPRRSFFDHLRKNFRVNEDSPRATAEDLSRKSESLPIRPSELDVTSSCDTKVNESTNRGIMTF